MNSDECKLIQEQISDYIQGGLDEPESDLIRTHLNTCNECQLYHKETESTINLLLQNKAPDMPDTFWKAYPEQILEAYKTQKIEEVKSRASWFDIINSKLADFISRPLVPAAIAGMLIVIVGLTLYPQQDSAQYSSVIVWVNQLSNQNDAQQVISKHALATDAGVSFGFASNEQVNFFNVGQTYFSTITSIYSNNPKQAGNQLKTISSLIAPFSDKSAVVLIKNIVHQISETSKPNKQILIQLSKVENTLSQSAKSNGEFQHGLWESGLLIAKLDLLLKINKSNYLNEIQPYFIKLENKLKSSDMPPGVTTAISDINIILLKNNRSSDDISKLNKLSEKIKQLLG